MTSTEWNLLPLFNDPPSESEAKRLRNTLLRDAQEDLDRMDQRIARLLAAVEVAQKERNQIQQFTDAHKSIVSAVRRVPPEIWLESFRSLRDCYRIFHGRFEVFDTNKPPWILGRVCSRWRATALSYSTLWSSMPLSHRDFRFRQKQIPKEPLSLLQVALDRTGQHPLDIAFACNSFPRQVQKDMLDALIPHMSRWQSASFVISPELLGNFAEPKGPLSSLTSLVVKVKASEGIDEASTVVNCFKNAPQLRRVYLGGFVNPASDGDEDSEDDDGDGEDEDGDEDEDDDGDDDGDEVEDGEDEDGEDEDGEDHDGDSEDDNGDGDGDEVEDLLSLVRPIPPLLPHLEVLSFGISSEDERLSVNFIGPIFVDFVRTRWLADPEDHVAKIRSVKFNSYSHCLKDIKFEELNNFDIDMLKGFQTDGLEISIRGNDQSLV